MDIFKMDVGQENTICSQSLCHTLPIGPPPLAERIDKNKVMVKINIELKDHHHLVAVKMDTEDYQERGRGRPKMQVRA